MKCYCGTGTLENIAETTPLVNKKIGLAKATMVYACDSCDKKYKRHKTYDKLWAKIEAMSGYNLWDTQLKRQEIMDNARKCMGDITKNIEKRIINRRK